jgi:cytochrome c peroxidase
MMTKSKVQFSEIGRPQEDPPASKPVNRHRFLKQVIGAFAICVLWGGVAPAQDQNKDDGSLSAAELRRYIGQQVGGIDKLKVPDDAHLPPPRLPDGTITNDPRFQNTEAKRYLGKLLFFEPARTVRIIPEFGGVLATRQTGSCGACHLGEVAGKSGTRINFSVGGEGRSYTDAQGNFIPRRRARVDILPQLRQTPLFPDDALVDELPTLTDVYQFAIGDPGRAEKLPPPGNLLETGRLDALDSVARNVPNLVGTAFNNRLLLGGFAGDPDASPGGLNPLNLPAQESLSQLTLDAHRMLDNDPRLGTSDGNVRFQSAVLEQTPAFRKLFRDAFPEEAAQSPGCVPESAPAPGGCDLLINDTTVIRATATFLRSLVTRNTAFDKFLDGDNDSLTPQQRRGAQLFFTSAKAGGGGCLSCHSGPMLNKQLNDPDVTGTGQFVTENFINIGLSDQPVQALNREARHDPNFIDNGRMEITGLDSDIYGFKTPTMRQLKGSGFFFHNGAFTNVRDVVQYFNAGVPQNAVTGASPNLSPRFTHPRGSGLTGLGLSDRQVDDITAFLEDALYDPAFAKFDPNSTTRSMQPNARDLTYSVYRPDLAALGAKDGFMPSGLPVSVNDPLSRRDAGLEFLDVTSQAKAVVTGSTRNGIRQQDVYQITNTNSSSVIDTHLLVIVQGLSSELRLENASGTTSTGDPYIRVFLPNGVLQPGQSISQALTFTRKPLGPPFSAGPLPVTLKLLSGQGTP